MARPGKATSARPIILAGGMLALAIVRWLHRSRRVSTSHRSPEALPSPNELDRLRAFAMRTAGDPEAARFRAEVAAERAAGIPPERFIGREELAAKRHAVRRG